MKIIAVGRKTLAVLSVLGLAASAPALWAAGTGDQCGCCGGTPAASDATPGVANAQTTCPILGGKINKKVFADYEGKRVYFCCAMCAPTFNKDPAKYVKEMETKGIVLDKTPPPASSAKSPQPGSPASKN